MTAERARVDDAASPPAPASPGTRIRACLVVLGGEPFAIDVLCLREVMIVDKLTRLPRAPAFVRGVANLRGEVLAILDVAPVLGLPACGVGPGTRALVLEPASRQVAIAVDEILGLETFDELRPHDDAVRLDQPAFGVGWLDRQGRLVTLLDVPSIVQALKLRSRATGSRASARRDGTEGESR